MKKYLLASAALVMMGFVAPASAADLAARPYTKAPPLMVAAYDWSGFYIGANGGYGTARKTWDFITPGGAFVATEGSHDSDGATAGGQIGYRWQSGQIVYGIEAQGNWADLRGSNVSVFSPTFTNTSRLRAFGLFTGQIGYAFNNALLYVKGGAAVTDNRYSTTNGILAASATDTRFGAAVGAGLEYGFTPNWSAAVEYNHLFVEGRNYNFTTPAGTLVGNDRIRGDADLITAKINYRWGGPVVARY